MLKSQRIFLLLSLISFSPLFSVNQSITIKNIYHHRGSPHAYDNALELGNIAFYFSAKPVIQKIDSKLISGNMQRNTYRIQGARLNAEQQAKLPIITKHYTLALRNVGNDVHMIVSYNAQKVASELNTFDSISLQKGVSIHFLNRMLCNVRQPYIPAKKKNRQKTVVIDCGHGGSDAGAIGHDGIKEKDIVLRVGLRVAQLLKKANIRVLLTRSSDQDVSLDARTSYANNHDADLFVSIHANASKNASAQGIDTFCISTPLLHNENQLSDSICGNVLRDTLQLRADESKRLAQLVHQSIITNVKKQYSTVVDRTIKYEVAQILLGSYMPAILIELGFVTHEQEAKRLHDQSYQNLLAASICDGIVAYVKQ